MRYVDWVDRVLAALDALAMRDPRASIIGVTLQELKHELQVDKAEHGDEAVVTAVNDLELMNCAQADRMMIKVTAQGQRFARAGGLRPGWKSLFQHTPVDGDRTVLATAVALSVHDGNAHAWTQRVEMKEVLGQVGQPIDQGIAIAVIMRLKEMSCIHPNPRMTLGSEGACEVRPSYVGIVIATEQRTTEERALLAGLLDEWETASVDVKEVLALDSDRQKAEFCKDILALANTRVSGRRFLVTGFNDATRAFTTSVDGRVDAHRMESVFTAYCQPVPEVRYSVVRWAGGDAGLIEVVSDRKSLPYRLKRDVWKLKAGSVFVRHNTLVEVASEVASNEELSILTAPTEMYPGPTLRASSTSSSCCRLPGEAVKDCARRELLEETGLDEPGTSAPRCRVAGLHDRGADRNRRPPLARARRLPLGRPCHRLRSDQARTGRGAAEVRGSTPPVVERLVDNLTSWGHAVTTLDLAVRYGQDGSVEVEGSRGVLKALAELLRSAKSIVIALSIPSASPHPYSGWLESIDVRVENEPQLLISRYELKLVLRGGRKSLEVLGDNVENLADSLDEDESHTHIEHFPGHYYLREGSIPLIVSIA